MFETAVTLSVICQISAILLTDRQRGWRPQRSRFVVSHVYRFARRIADGIVRPRRELILLTVDGPGEATAVCRHLKSERWICDDIDPRRGRVLSSLENGQVFAAIVDKPAKSIMKFHRW